MLADVRTIVTGEAFGGIHDQEALRVGVEPRVGLEVLVAESMQVVIVGADVQAIRRLNVRCAVTFPEPAPNAKRPRYPPVTARAN